MPSLIGYARVSTYDQNTDTQVERLRAAGCTTIRKEVVSGKSRKARPELATVLDFIGEGDRLVVVKLDRLGRDTRDVLNIVHELERKGAKLQILDPAISTDGPMGKVVLTVLGMVAEMELGFIRDRQRVGIEAAKSKGIYRGRPVKLDWGRIKQMHAEGKGPTEISRAIGCSRGMVYKVLWGKATPHERASSSNG